MKAAVFYGPDRPLAVEDVPTPTAGPEASFAAGLAVLIKRTVNFRLLLQRFQTLSSGQPRSAVSDCHCLKEIP